MPNGNDTPTTLTEAALLAEADSPLSAHQFLRRFPEGRQALVGIDAAVQGLLETHRRLLLASVGEIVKAAQGGAPDGAR